MTEEKAEYKTKTDDAMEMLGVGYNPVIQFEPPSEQIIETEDGYETAQSLGWVKFSACFRKGMLAKLKGAKLSIFMCICLHVNEKGNAFPGIDTIAEETGLHRDTVLEIIPELEEIPGLLKVIRERGKRNMYYPAFASRGKQSEPRLPVGKIPTTPVDPPVGKSPTPVVGISPTLSREEEEEEEGAFSSPAIDPRWDFNFKGDYTQYPQDVREILIEFCLLWNFPVPSFKTKSKKGRGAYWLQGLRELQDSCGEFGVEALIDYRKHFERYMQKHNGLAPFDVNSPKSLVNVVSGHAAKMRAGTNILPEQDTPEPSDRLERLER